MSYALHFYLVRGPLALFLQHSWGNADSNPVKDVEYMTRDYLLATEIIQAMAETKLWQLSQQLVVYHSNLRLDSQWAVLTPGSSEIVWHRTQFGQVLKTVLEVIKRSQFET